MICISKEILFDFFRADQDHDERLSHNELLDHVFKNIQQHSNEAKDRNSQLFILIDTDKNGQILFFVFKSNSSCFR
jgi:hypothetical protein